MKTEQIKQILADVPDVATHVDSENGYLQFDEFGDSKLINGKRYLNNTPDMPSVHSLSDLREILSLRERVAELEKLNKKASL